MPVSKNKIRLPKMTPGTARSIAWLRFGRAGARPKVYLQAAIHANELPGAMALHHLMPMLAEAERAGRVRGEVIVVPTVNPIGQSQLVGNSHLGRYDLLSRDNFNRNWLDLSDAVADRVGPKLAGNPAANVDLIRKAALAALKAMQPMNELQTMRVEIMKLSIDADVVLDLHCDMDAALHLFTAAPDLKGAAQELAADLGIPVTMYNEPFAQALTFSGVNGALWPRLAARFQIRAIEVDERELARHEQAGSDREQKPHAQHDELHHASPSARALRAVAGAGRWGEGLQGGGSSIVPTSLRDTSGAPPGRPPTGDRIGRATS